MFGILATRSSSWPHGRRPPPTLGACLRQAVLLTMPLQRPAAGQPQGGGQEAAQHQGAPESGAAPQALLLGAAAAGELSIQHRFLSSKPRESKQASKAWGGRRALHTQLALQISGRWPTKH